ncbi:MAG: hypothetical protein HDR03_11225 [Lachnospiraceae bacterium]|nr:hypothetical protein [Lachnospiraceae bacterium]
MKKQEFQEEWYIYKRKLKAFFHSLPFYICRVFPINTHKIVMWTLEGKGGYGDSPKYIAEEIIKRNRGGKEKYEIIWLADDPEKEFPAYIKTVRNTLWKRAYHLSTAAFWIGNTRTDYGTRKRHNTIYIQTWHAIVGLKPIGKQRGSRLPRMARIVSEYDSGLIDYVLSGNEWSNKMWPDGLLYYGAMLQTGVPRCDVLFYGKDQMHRKYREKYDLPQDVSIILYAPTFRGGSQSGRRSVNADIGSLNFEKLIDALERRFGGTWYVFLRLHPQVAEESHSIIEKEKNGRVIDVSHYADMNELIAASDVFLTDYSSSIFESAIMMQPGFLFVEDEEEYVKDRGELVFRLKELPFPVAYDMEGLERHIEMFDQTQYESDLKKFMEMLGMFEDGMASGRVVDLIEGIAEKKN